MSGTRGSPTARRSEPRFPGRTRAAAAPKRPAASRQSRPAKLPTEILIDLPRRHHSRQSAAPMTQFPCLSRLTIEGYDTPSVATFLGDANVNRSVLFTNRLLACALRYAYGSGRQI